jgi:predicted nucleic acid-binding protein
LLRAEALRALRLHGPEAFERGRAALRRVDLIGVSDRFLDAAATLDPPTLRTLDAIHLVTALRLADAGAIEAILTYDVRLADGARHHGLTALAPKH